MCGWVSESCSTSLSEQAGECYHFHLGPSAVTIPFSTSHHPVFHPQGKLRHRHSFVTIVIAFISISRISRTDVSIASNHEAEPASRHTTSHRHSPRILVYNPHTHSGGFYRRSKGESSSEPAARSAVCLGAAGLGRRKDRKLCQRGKASTAGLELQSPR